MAYRPEGVAELPLLISCFFGVSMTKPSSAINDYLVRELQPAAHDPTKRPVGAVRKDQNQVSIRPKIGVIAQEAQDTPDAQQVTATDKSMAQKMAKAKPN